RYMESNHSLKNVITGLAESIFKLIGNVTALALTEAQLAGRNITVILLLFSGVALGAVASWLGICGIVCLSLIQAGFGPIFSLIIMIVLNFLLMAFFSLIIFRLKDNLF